MTDKNRMNDLLAIMERLRDPDTGCPWDVEQDFNSIAPYTIEEAYEVADAIDKGDMDNLKEELGDLLFQTVFHTQLAKEQGLFDFNDVVAAISEKMISRHPHVFGDASIADADAQTEAWEQHKARERADKHKGSTNPSSVLDSVPRGLPALSKALKLQKRAAREGFDWVDVKDVLAKLNEEIAEVSEALSEKGKNHPDVLDEFGDLLFVIVNLGRHLNIDSEDALRRGNAKFERRFRAIEHNLSQKGQAMNETKLEDLEAEWQKVKAQE